MSDSPEDETLTKSKFDQSVRNLIDQFLQSGGEVEEIEEILEHHRDGAQYYLEDLQRSIRMQQQQQQQLAAETDPEEIEEDSVERVDSE